MISLVICLCILASLIVIIVYSFKRMRTTSDSYTIQSSKLSYDMPKSESTLSSKDWKLSTETYEIEEFTLKRGIGLVSLSALILGVHVSIFIPAISNLITWTKGEPLWGLTIIYLPYMIGLTMLISGITRKELFNFTTLRFVATIVLSTLLGDLWMPAMIIKRNLDVYISWGYRVSPDYVSFSVWKRLFGLGILKKTFLGLTIGWLLTYVLSTVVICFVIWVIWWVWWSHVSHEEL